jgi:hypothetical protein
MSSVIASLGRLPTTSDSSLAGSVIAPVRSIFAAITTTIPISRFVALILSRSAPSLASRMLLNTGSVLLPATACSTIIMARFRCSRSTNAFSADVTATRGRAGSRQPSSSACVRFWWEWRQW